MCCAPVNATHLPTVLKIGPPRIGHLMWRYGNVFWEQYGAILGIPCSS